MLVSELRELLKKYKEDDLRLLVAEMYKVMPKKLREDKDIDELLQDPHAYLSIGKIERTKDTQVDLYDLIPEIEQFIDYAYKQYYFAPNSFVHKKERPKWRFKVKSYIKSLQSVPLDGEDGKKATSLLEKLYGMLSYACGYYIFNTEDPFRSVGIEQTALYDMVLKRKFGSGINRESVRSAILLLINSIMDRVTLYSYLMNVLIANLKTPDSKELAIEQCMALKEELKTSKPNSKKGYASEYEYNRKINNLVEMVFRLNVEMCEYEEAIKYFNRNYIEHDKEISLYVLLNLLFHYDQKEYWVREYGEALKRGVEPRERLKQMHQYIKENDKLPDYTN